MIGVAIVTYQGEKSIAECLTPLLQSPLKPRILVIDSSSTDQTVPIANGMGVETVVIPKKEFNHGLTREKARRILNTPIVVFLTQDAILVNADSLAKLTLPIVQKKASITYARQLAHRGAGFFETFHREFNYPPVSQYRALGDVEKYGVYTCFCSDSCAAYENGALEEIGGFPETDFGEDALVAAQLILRGHTIGYIAESQVWHSHRYSLKEEFSRHIAIGRYRKRHAHLFEQFGSDQKRGREYALTLFKKLLITKPWLIPFFLIQSVLKWLGYCLGRGDYCGK